MERARALRLTSIFICALLLPLAARALRAAQDSGLTVQTLSARSAPRGLTLFTTLSPAETGVVAENRYADPRMWGERYHEFGVGAIGTGVAVGDYDGDGRPDIFVVSKTESCRLFRNLGDWKFEDTTAKAGVEDVGAAAAEWKQGATFVDVNNDGRLDLYVCRFAAPNLLYVNQGDGTFKEEAAARGLAVKDASGMAAFCDYDRDGWLDVYLQTNLLAAAAHPAGQRDYLFRNQGDGMFSDVTHGAGIAGEAQGHSATWWDHDNDGWPDLYVANDFAGPDVLYHNNGDGTFTNVLERVVPHTPFSAMGADLGDVNNDGLLDFLVADMAATTHQKDQRGMADSRARGKEDYENPGGTPQYLRNALYLNTAAGPSLEAAYLTGLAATDWTWAPRFEDLDNDGWVDLFVTTGMNREQHNTDLITRMMGAENPLDRARFMRMSPVLKEANLAYRNTGDLRFETVGPEWGLDHKSVSFGAAFGDFDGDGDLDLVFTNFEEGPTMLRNDSDSGHRVIVMLRGTVSNRFGVGATVRIETASGVQVRSLVLARGYLSSSEPVVHFGTGRDALIDRLTITWPGGAVQSFEQLPVDRRFIITEPDVPVDLRRPAKPSAGRFAEVSATADFGYDVPEEVLDETVQQPMLPFRLNRRGPALAVGDLDGDGSDDVVLGGTTKSGPRLLRGESAAGRLALAVALPADTGLNDGPILVFDANGDGHNDLLFTKGGVSLPAGAPAYQPRLFINNGRGGMTPAPEGTLPALSICVGATAAADFDRDGRLDLFLGARVAPGQYPEASHSVLLLNRGTHFEDVTATMSEGLANIGLVTAALWSDVDADGWMDLLITLEWGGVRYWHNDQGRGFEDRSDVAGFTAAGTGWWTSLAAADFNRDGRLDYVVGNVGLNTPYTASTECPTLMYYGEFHDEGGLQIIEAAYDGDRVVPRRSRRHLGAKIPSILKRFPRNDAYARATLAEIVGEDRIAAAQRFSATELSSGIFLSENGGRVRFEALPRVMQIAPVQGLAAGDFDGDGLADIYAVQNSHAPVYVTGHFDGGLSQLLHGDGRGGFVAVPPASSGLVVTGDAKALAVIDLDQDRWPDFLITRNNGSTLAFRNNSMAGRDFLRVVLSGPTRNRTAVGALVTAQHADGTHQTMEIHAGSGYYSQSTSAVFLGYLLENPVRHIRVRWPSGETSEHSVADSSQTLFLSSP